ncbi:MAG: adenylyl-sulfate kinase [Pseudomonadota bacterium]
MTDIAVNAFFREQEAVPNATCRLAAIAVQSIQDNRQLPPTNTFWHNGQVSHRSRQELFGYRPATIWLTGLSGAGKSTIAFELEKRLLAEGRPCYVLDGDNLRHHLNRDLGFSAEDRRENIRRTAEVARLMNEAGLIVISALISPYRDNRDMAKQIIGENRFVEVYVSTSTDVCEARDPKGLYAKARAGKIAGFTGVSAIYEPPLAPALALDTSVMALSDSAQAILVHLADGYFGGVE